MKHAVGIIFVGLLLSFASIAWAEDEGTHVIIINPLNIQWTVKINIQHIYICTCLSVEDLNCYTCKSDNATDCQTISKSQTKYLEKCTEGACFVMEEEDRMFDPAFCLHFRFY